MTWNQGEVETIIRRAPWHFNGDLLLIERGRPFTAPSEYNLYMADFWVCIHDVPNEILNSRVIIKLANQLGEVITPILAGVEETWSSYARIKVRLNINTPLANKIQIMLPNGSLRSFPITYEWLPRVCHLCGLIGHELETCVDLEK